MAKKADRRNISERKHDSVLRGSLNGGLTAHTLGLH